MKTYEKPKLVALSLSGNDVLCAGCDIDAVEPNMSLLIKLMIEGMSNPFAEDDSSCADTVEGYCKFTYAEENKSVIFES